MTHPENAAGIGRDEASKRVYVKPAITAYGKLVDLTAGSTSKKNDPGGPQNGKS